MTSTLKTGNPGSSGLGSAISVLCAVLALTAGPALAVGAARDCIAKGTGSDRRSAILDSLLQAVQQVNGISINEKSVTDRRYADLLDDIKQSFSASVIDTDQIQTASHGLIQGYEILSEAQNPQTHATEVQTKVSVLLYDPASPLLSGQRKVIAVLPFRNSRQSYRIFDADIPADRAQAALSQDLVQNFVQSRKFTVLDRDFLAELLGEQQLIQAGNMPTKEQLRIGQQLGADFLLVGSLDDLDAGAVGDTDHLTGAPVALRHAKATVAYRVLNVATGKVNWADTYHHTYGPEELDNPPPDRVGLRPEEVLLLDAASAISDQVITGVFPIRVLSIDGSEVILNQGGSRTAIGDTFDVYNLGKELIDPDTNEPLERVEIFVARIRISRATNKLSYAAIIAGDASKISLEDAVCRRHNDVSAKYLQRPATDADGLVTPVLVVSGRDAADADMSQTLAGILRSSGVKADEQFFTPAVVGDGVFDRIFRGSATDLAALELSQRCNYLVLAQKTDDLASHRELQGMITGNGSLTIRVIRSSDGQCMDQFTVAADASGFEQNKAENRLDQNLAQKVNKHGFGAWISDGRATVNHPTN